MTRKQILETAEKCVNGDRDQMRSKVEKSIDVLKTAAKISQDWYGEPLIIAYSGGKDSDVMLQLALEAGIEFEVVYSTTTVDAPQTLAHISRVFRMLEERGIKARRTKPVYKGKPVNMFSLIEQKGIPPTRLIRYCCSVFKEASTPRRITAIGVRAAESRGRQGRSDFTTRGRTKADDKHFSIGHVQEVFESAKEQDPVWDCTMVTAARKKKALLTNPIYDWTDKDVWEFIREREIPYNSLYDMGYSRVGCILCPLARKAEKAKDEQNFPKVRENYIKAFDRMLERRRAAGVKCEGYWADGEAVYRWWVEDDTIPGQMRLDLGGDK